MTYDPDLNNFAEYLKRADGVEVSPVTFTPDLDLYGTEPGPLRGTYEVTEEKDPNVFAWSVYLHVDGNEHPAWCAEYGPAYNVADCGAKDDALAIAALLERAIKTARRGEVPRSRDFLTAFHDLSVELAGVEPDAFDKHDGGSPFLARLDFITEAARMIEELSSLYVGKVDFWAAVESYAENIKGLAEADEIATANLADEAKAAIARWTEPADSPELNEYRDDLTPLAERYGPGPCVTCGTLCVDGGDVGTVVCPKCDARPTIAFTDTTLVYCPGCAVILGYATPDGKPTSKLSPDWLPFIHIDTTDDLGDDQTKCDRCDAEIENVSGIVDLSDEEG